MIWAIFGLATFAAGAACGAVGWAYANAHAAARRLRR